MNKKKILIIGAGFLQSFVIKRAKELGYYVIAIDKNPDSFGFSFADESHVVDIVDQNATLNFALERKIDGVLTVATDYGVISTALIAKSKGLPGLDYETSKLIKNKYLVRQKLFDDKVDDISQFFEIETLSQLEQIIHQVKFPVMVKPCDGSGSKGASRVDSSEQLSLACLNAINSSISGKALIEDFIEGEEYGVESFVLNNEVHILGVLGKEMTVSPFYAELGHTIPSGLELNTEIRIKQIVKKAIDALCINFGAVNMDILITKDNKICVIDVGARMGGNLIGSHIIPLATGKDYMGMIIKSCCDDYKNITSGTKHSAVVTKILALTPGKIVQLPNFVEISNKCNVEIFHHLEEGQLINEYHDNTDGCGYVLAYSNNKKESLMRVELAKNMIDKGIIRE